MSTLSIHPAGATLLLALAVSGAGCGDASESPPTPSPAASTPSPTAAPVCEPGAWAGPSRRWNVVVVLADTLRRDVVGAYGGAAATPAFDAFAADAWRYERAASQAPWTSPSVATLFTSLYPSQHGVLSNPERRVVHGQSEDATPDPTVDVLAPGLTTLAERLRDAGHETAAFVSNPWLGRRLGFAQGFDHYDDSFADWDVPGEVVSRAALDWLDGRAEDSAPFFLYVHYMDCHRPYVPLAISRLVDAKARLNARHRELAPVHDSLSDETLYEMSQIVFLEGGQLAAPTLGVSIAFVEEAYRAGVEQLDRALGQLLDGLRAAGAYDDTLVLVLSDHGESLYDRGFGNHGRSLYEDELAIPFVLRLPGASPARPDCWVGPVDVVPTLAAALDLPAPEPAFGRSLLTPLPGDRGLVAEAVLTRPGDRAYRKGDAKLLYQPTGGADGVRRALFDLASDPGERHDLLAPGADGKADPSATARYVTLLDEMRAAVPDFERPDAAEVTLDPDEVERLRSLGYAP